MVKDKKTIIVNLISSLESFLDSLTEDNYEDSCLEISHDEIFAVLDIFKFESIAELCLNIELCEAHKDNSSISLYEDDAKILLNLCKDFIFEGGYK